MADVSQIKLPDGNTYNIKDNGASTATNWVNGSATNSVRTTGSASEDSGYTIGIGAVAEGYGTEASGNSSHAEGTYTTASGIVSHAEGDSTTASGLASHAEGNNTIANHIAQHVFGAFNIADPSAAASTALGNYIEIVGNGTSSTRSNARTLDWSGNEVLAGKLTVGVVGTNSMDVATVGQIPTVPSNIVNTITTTAGAHTAISNQTGNVSFNVPTNTSHLTNDSGFITNAGVTGIKGNSESTYRTGEVNLTAANIGAQPTLVSGTNIKTINNQSLLSSGNISTTLVQFVRWSGTV